jgi:F420-non-reducing hydrogenase iron-sulfur subunit
MSDKESLNKPFEPRIVAFFCNWCTYTATDLAGTARMTYAPNVRVIRVMCSGRIDPQFVLAAFRRGADAVLIGGCHPGDCHYQEGNYNALRRFTLLRNLLTSLGIEKERVRLEWIAASEGDKVQKVINEMTEAVRRLGPLRLEPAAYSLGKEESPEQFITAVTAREDVL